MPSIAGLVLAAGRAQRMGGRPKPLLELDGQPLIRRLVGAMVDAGVEPVLVVIPSPDLSSPAAPFAAAIARALEGSAARTVPNPDPDSDLIGSQRLGLAALGAIDAIDATHTLRAQDPQTPPPPKCSAVLIALADQPLVDAPALSALLQAWAHRPAGVQMLYPRVAGEPGNPVVVGPEAVREVLASDARTGCKQWREAHPERSLAWDTDNPAYITDLDTEQDLQHFVRRTGRELRWPDLDGPAPQPSAR